MGKLLSIVMPTFNRAWILPFSLSLIKDQVVRNSDNVELIICNNNASDNTSDLLSSMIQDDPWFKFVDYNDHAEIGISISRSIDNAEGKYFLLWGDDDVPDPHMIDVLVDSLLRHPDVACIHFNRLQGSGGIKEKMSNLRVFYKKYNGYCKLYEDSEIFIKENFRGMTFLSVDLISVKAWKKGKQIYTTDHYGFEYLAPFLYGISGSKCLYINYPLCIQRCLKNPIYREKWPAYLYLGVPRLLKTLEELKVISSWKEIYDIYKNNSQFNSSFAGYLNNMVYWATRNSSFYRPLVSEINSYQNSILNKAVTYIVYMPNFINKFNRAIVGCVLKVLHK